MKCVILYLYSGGTSVVEQSEVLWIVAGYSSRGLPRYAQSTLSVVLGIVVCVYRTDTGQLALANAAVHKKESSSGKTACMHACMHAFSHMYVEYVHIS